MGPASFLPLLSRCCLLPACILSFHSLSATTRATPAKLSSVNCHRGLAAGAGSAIGEAQYKPCQESGEAVQQRGEGQPCAGPSSARAHAGTGLTSRRTADMVAGCMGMGRKRGRGRRASGGHRPLCACNLFEIQHPAWCAVLHAHNTVLTCAMTHGNFGLLFCPVATASSLRTASIESGRTRPNTTCLSSVETSGGEKGGDDSTARSRSSSSAGATKSRKAEPSWN